MFYERRKKINWEDKKCRMAEIDLTVKRMGKREIESHIMEFLKPFYLKFKTRLDQIKLCETQRVNRIIA